MRVYGSGASGFVGAHVADELARRGADVRSERVELLDPRALERAVRGCDAVVHAAALYSYDAPLDRMLAVNVEGTRNLLDACARRGVRRFLYTSTAGTCGPVPGRAATERDGPPPWELSVPYKRTKLAAERLVLAAARSGIEALVVNPTTPVGSGDRRPTPTGRMLAGVARGRIRGYVACSGLNVVDVRDVARGHALALERGRAGARYLLGGVDRSLGDLFAEIAALAGRSAPVRVPYVVAQAAALVGLANPNEVRLARLPMFFSSDRARAALGYEPGPVRPALTAAVAEALAYQRSRRASRSDTAPSAAPASPSRR
jgi:dihydroflavonol-4-reductase